MMQIVVDWLEVVVDSCEEVPELGEAMRYLFLYVARVAQEGIRRDSRSDPIQAIWIIVLRK